jgi:lysophospholipid acyltransferase (LPLAT)-like uncharacterized protein
MSERRVRWTVRLGAAVIRLLAMTWRYRVTNDRVIRDAHAAGHRIIYTLWHGELLPLLWHHRSQGVAVVISEHRDGEIIARIAESLGYATIRGSTSRGAGRALIGVIRTIAQGHDVAVTPDGPRGPAHVFAPGAAIAAQRSGAVLIPVRADATWAWRLKSWDRFVIPKPFARVLVGYGEATRMEASSPREAAEQTDRLQALMHAVRIA